MEKPPAEREPFLALAASTPNGSDPGLLEEVRRLIQSHEGRVTFLDGTLTASPELRTDPSRMEGRRLGHFEILREIGRGGMGTVYLARRVDGLFEQQVAIKVVTPSIAGPEVIRRFQQEREILASLDHPNIARLHDGGTTEEGWPYFVMEYVEGRPIDEWCDQRRLNVSDRVRLFRKVCEAVHAAHRSRVVHRDLKPSNILVKDDGTVKLLDFGIAKLVRDSGEEESLVTISGMRLMTPEYASPEQVRQEEITPLSDVYSLGVVLYELLTGRRPYRLKSRMLQEIVRVICETETDRPSTVVLRSEERFERGGTTTTVAPGQLSGIREGSPVDLQRRLSGDLDAVLLKALRKDPAERYRSVAQLDEDLERHLSGQPVLAVPDWAGTAVLRYAKRHLAALVLGFAGLAALLTGGIQVNLSGLQWLGGGLLAVGAFALMTNRKLGEQSAEWRYPWTQTVSMLVLVMLHFWYTPALPLALATIAAFQVYKLALWATRARWAGGLLLRTQVDCSQAGLAMVVAPKLYSFAHADLLALGIPRWESAGALLVAFVLTIAVPITLARMEVRERGILFQGRLIPWVKIESYEWDSVDSPWSLVSMNLSYVPKERLVLRTRRVPVFLPLTRIKVSGEYQEELTRILNRHLAIWPEA